MIMTLSECTMPVSISGLHTPANSTIVVLDSCTVSTNEDREISHLIIRSNKKVIDFGIVCYSGLRYVSMDGRFGQYLTFRSTKAPELAGGIGKHIIMADGIIYKGHLLSRKRFLSGLYQYVFNVFDPVSMYERSY